MNTAIETSVLNSQSFNQAAAISVLDGLEAYAAYARQSGVGSDRNGHRKIVAQLIPSNENARAVLEIVYKDFAL